MSESDFNSFQWESNSPNPMSPAEQATFQIKLDDVVGVEPNGTKRWKLLWAPDPETWTWNRYANVWQPRFEHYWANAEITLQDQSPKKVRKHGKIIDTVVVTEPIALPRFFLGALLPRIHRNPIEDAAGRDEQGTPYSKRKYRGEEYVTLFTITQHSAFLDFVTKEPTCCKKRRETLNVACKGDFRFPDDRDIEHLQQMFEEKMHMRIARPDERVDAASKNTIWQQALSGIKAEIDRRKAVQAEVKREYSLLEFIKSHNRPNPGGRKNHFSIPGL